MAEVCLDLAEEEFFPALHLFLSEFPHSEHLGEKVLRQQRDSCKQEKKSVKDLFFLPIQNCHCFKMETTLFVPSKLMMVELGVTGGCGIASKEIALFNLFCYYRRDIQTS